MSVDKDVTRLYRIYKTLHQMIHDRGYAVTQAELDMSMDDFLGLAHNGQIDRGNLSILVQKANDPSDQLIVFFPEDHSVGIKPIRRLLFSLLVNGKGFLLRRQRQALSEFSGTSYDIRLESFLESELLVNITEHVLVPKHVCLDVTEKKALLKKYRLTEVQLPRMASNDPVARYYGLKRGDVVKIIRPSETAGRYVTYRLVS